MHHGGGWSEVRQASLLTFFSGAVSSLRKRERPVPVYTSTGSRCSWQWKSRFSTEAPQKAHTDSQRLWRIVLKRFIICWSRIFSPPFKLSTLMMRLFPTLLPLSILQLYFLRTIDGFLSPSPVKGGNGRFFISSTTARPQPQPQRLPTIFNNRQEAHYHANNNSNNNQNRRCRSSSLSLSSTVSSFFNNQDLMPGIAAIDARNGEILEKLEKLRTSPYFRFFSVDILASCEYIPQELVECYTESCEIYPADEEKVCMTCRMYHACDIGFNCMMVWLLVFLCLKNAVVSYPLLDSQQYSSRGSTRTRVWTGWMGSMGHAQWRLLRYTRISRGLYGL